MISAPSQNHQNNFDFMRLLAASLVVWSHCFALLGLSESRSCMIKDQSCGYIAVSIFFILSGYLVTSSLMHSSGVLSYFLKRALRIYPAYIASLLFCWVIVGLVPEARHYLSEFFTRTFLSLSIYIIEIPWIFSDLPNKAINGSYWTLRLELTAYILLGLVFITRQLNPPTLLAIACVALVSHHLTTGSPETIFFMPYWQVTCFIYFFFSSAFLYLAREKIDWNFHYFLICCIIFVAAAWLENLRVGMWFGISASRVIMMLVLPYAIIYAGRNTTPFLRGVGKYGDFSYGVYLYSFPVQQLILYWHGTDISPVAFFLISYPISIVMAAASWHMLEKKALLFKRKIP